MVEALQQTWAITRHLPNTEDVSLTSFVKSMNVQMWETPTSAQEFHEYGSGLENTPTAGACTCVSPLTTHTALSIQTCHQQTALFRHTHTNTMTYALHQI